LLAAAPAARAATLDPWPTAFGSTAAMAARAGAGPLGALSFAVAADPSRREQRIEEAIGSVIEITRAAQDAGLTEFLIEPTPLQREMPHTPDEAILLHERLSGEAAIPVRYVVDIGHALYQPLYGASASLDDWLPVLGDRVGILHIQNTDFQSDSHWGWPDDRGLFDVADFAASVEKAGLGEVPVFLEVFHPFELADEALIENITSPVEACQTGLGKGHA